MCIKSSCNLISTFTHNKHSNMKPSKNAATKNVKNGPVTKQR